MRVLAMLIGCLVIAASAAATPVQYSFTGVMSGFSTLTQADGTIVDIGNAPFTARGTTNGDVLGPWTGLFLATTTYDFGALGSFTTDVGADTYVQRNRSGGAVTVITEIGLIAFQPADLIGFTIQIAGITIPDPTTTAALGAVVPLQTDHGNSRTQANAAGQRLRFTWGPNPIRIQISSASVDEVPEPATVSLLLVGLALVVVWRGRHG